MKKSTIDVVDLVERDHREVEDEHAEARALDAEATEVLPQIRAVLERERLESLAHDFDAAKS